MPRRRTRRRAICLLLAFIVGMVLIPPAHFALHQHAFGSDASEDVELVDEAQSRDAIVCVICHNLSVAGEVEPLQLEHDLSAEALHVPSTSVGPHAAPHILSARAPPLG